jgi:hypothetical protein
MLSAAVDRLTLAKLRVRLDWRSFVDVDTHALIDHPNNYYCVAFGTAAVQEDVAYHAPTGPLMTKVLCESAARTVQAPLKLSWTLSYQ